MHYFRLCAFLVFSWLMSSLLAACTTHDRPEWMNSLMGKTSRPYSNTAGGPRHPPALNPKPGSLKGPVSPKMPPSPENNPYDYYHGVGAPEEAAPMPPPSPGADAGNKISPARKSFPVNLPYTDTIAPAAALPATETVQVPPQMPIAEAVTAPAPPSTAKEAAAYPNLSTVPYAPPEFRAVKAAKEKEMRLLQQEYDQAQQQKRRLEEAETPAAAPAPPTGVQAPVLLGHAQTPAADDANALTPSSAPSAAEPLPDSRYAERLRELENTAIHTPAQY